MNKTCCQGLTNEVKQKHYSFQENGDTFKHLLQLYMYEAVCELHYDLHSDLHGGQLDGRMGGCVNALHLSL